MAKHYLFGAGCFFPMCPDLNLRLLYFLASHEKKGLTGKMLGKIKGRERKKKNEMGLIQ